MARFDRVACVSGKKLKRSERESHELERTLFRAGFHQFGKSGTSVEPDVSDCGVREVLASGNCELTSALGAL